MNKEPLILLTAIGLVNYVVFHGHRLGQDCWLCQYRGLTVLGGSLILGTWLAFNSQSPRNDYESEEEE